MKVLSLWQPWASAVVTVKPNVFPVQGVKGWETRSWTTAYRGTLLIHAAMKSTAAQKHLLEQWPFSEYLEVMRPFDFGKIIGAVDLVDVVRTEDWMARNIHREAEGVFEEFHFGNYGPGRYAWKFENPRRFVRPVPFKGKQLLKGEFDGEILKGMIGDYNLVSFV